MSETKFGAWIAPQGNLVGVEYSLVVIEEIRQAVTEGFQRFARGGIEVGGVLYGTYDGKTARFLAVREIACEHAHGPSFVLSGKDRAALTDQLGRDRLDERLEGFQALGWYVSHTRSDIVLQQGDQETYEAFFPELWQVALVVRPGRGGAMRAGFFVREADGTVKTDCSYLDFNFPDRVANPPSQVDRSPMERHPPGGERREIPPSEAAVGWESPEAGFMQRRIDFAGPEAAGTQLPGNQLPVMQPVRAPEFTPSPEAKWQWRGWVIGAVVVLMAALLGIAGLRYFGGRNYFGAPSPAEPISLAVFEQGAEHEGQLRVEWNHLAAPIRNASAGTLEITDGKDVRTVALSKEDLLRGSFTYARTSGDVQIRLQVQNADGEKIQEASRFLGTPPRAAADPHELEAVQKERDELKNEVTRLRTANAAQIQRNQQLERTLTILRLRLGIATPDPR
jgi:hypothetical protein